MSSTQTDVRAVPDSGATAPVADAADSADNA